MRRTFRYRIYPNRVQTTALDAQLGEACRLYNAALQERRDAWKQARHSVSYYEQASQLKAIRADGSVDLANFSACQDVLRRVDKTFKAFFGRVKAGRKAGFPRFQSRRRYDSLTFPSYGDGCRLRANGRLYLQGAGEIKVKLHRPVDGEIKTVSVKREAGQWYALFSCEVEVSPLPVSIEAVGIDLGLATFAVLSDGSEIANPRFARKAAAVRRAQRKVARRARRSNGRRKAVVLLKRIHAHIANRRSDFHHKAARALVNRFGFIAVEDLNVKGMANGMLARPINDAGWSMFLQRLDDKAESAGRQVVRVNPNGTTQRCSGCQAVVPKMLSQGRHECPACGLRLS
nr:IS200/IS605 family element transposase accessory protein TnpB [Acidobacteriota bacterium]